jgi:hypothetical protein
MELIPDGPPAGSLTCVFRFFRYHLQMPSWWFLSERLMMVDGQAEDGCGFEEIFGIFFTWLSSSSLMAPSSLFSAAASLKEGSPIRPGGKFRKLKLEIQVNLPDRRVGLVILETASLKTRSGR